MLAQTSTRSIKRSPGGALIVGQGDDVDGDVAKILWLATGEVTRVRPEMVDLPDVAYACYLDARHALWCQFHRDVRIVPWERILALPRNPA